MTYRDSLRDIEVCLRSMQGKLYHMGFRGKVARSTLADANESRDWRIYADFAQVLIGIARPLYAHDPMGVDASWWYERDGILCQEPSISFDAGRLRTGLEVIANQLGKKLDEDNPLLHAHLPDGSRLAAAIPPVVCPAPMLTIRKFTSRHYTVDDLIARGTLTRPLADFLAGQIRSGKTLLISGGNRHRQDHPLADLG